MRKVIIMPILALITLVLVGCAGFGDMSDANNWYGVMGREAFIRHQNDMMAVEKLQATPVKTQIINGVSMGYYGKLVNNAKWPRNVKCSGPERKSFYLEAKGNKDGGDIVESYLIPGRYTCIAENTNGKRVATAVFDVGAQIHEGPGSSNMHWYVLIGQSGRRG